MRPADRRRHLCLLRRHGAPEGGLGFLQSPGRSLPLPYHGRREGISLDGLDHPGVPSPSTNAGFPSRSKTSKLRGTRASASSTHLRLNSPCEKMVPATGLEPVQCYLLEPESSASANSATRALSVIRHLQCVSDGNYYARTEANGKSISDLTPYAGGRSL
jgi:hypothetical protein